MIQQGIVLGENGDWQLLAAGLCVAWALLTLLRRTRRFWRGAGAGGCSRSGCGDCPSAAAVTGEPSRRPVVPLQLPSDRPGPPREAL